MAAEFFYFYQVLDDEPVEDSEEWFTSGIEQVGDYDPAVMRRSDIRRSGKSSENEVTISFARDNDFALSRLVNRFEIRYWVEVRIDPDEPPFWVGRLRSVSQNGSQINLVFSSLLATLKRFGLPAHFQQTCRHSLYDNVCRVKRDDKSSQEVTVTAISAADLRVQVTLPTPVVFPIKQAERGVLVQGNLRYYVNFTESSDILILRHLTGLQKATATLWRGCDRTVSTCRDVFSNLRNYGGFPNMPRSLVWGEDIPQYKDAESPYVGEGEE